MTRAAELLAVTAFGVCAVLVSPWWVLAVVVTLAYVTRVELGAPRDTAAERDTSRDVPRDIGRDIERERDRA